MTLALLALIGVIAAAAPEPQCGDMVLTDWYDGRIEGSYPPSCYREALDNLPEDIRVYTSAPTDIARALRAQLAADAAAKEAEQAKADRQPQAQEEAEPAVEAAQPTEGVAGVSRSLSSRGPAASSGEEEPAEEATALAADVTPSQRQLPLPLLAVLALGLAAGLAGSTSLVVRRVRR